MADEGNVRLLSEEEKRKIADNTKLVSDFKQKKLEKEAQKNWDLFYKRNATNFFKDRHWTTAEFKELLFGNSSEVFTFHTWIFTVSVSWYGHWMLQSLIQLTSRGTSGNNSKAWNNIELNCVHYILPFAFNREVWTFFRAGLLFKWDSFPHSCIVWTNENVSFGARNYECLSKKCSTFLVTWMQVWHN